MIDQVWYDKIAAAAMDAEAAVLDELYADKTAASNAWDEFIDQHRRARNRDNIYSGIYNSAPWIGGGLGGLGGAALGYSNYGIPGAVAGGLGGAALGVGAGKLIGPTAAYQLATIGMKPSDYVW